MPKIMKTLNNISRCQAYYRTEKIKIDKIPASHHTFILFISRNPGRAQEEIARELCLNKSTVTRTLNQLENNGYIKRTANPEDKRQYLIFPTDKLLGILPDIREIAKNWNNAISDGIPENELEIFHSVLSRMEEKAKKIISEL